MFRPSLVAAVLVASVSCARQHPESAPTPDGTPAPPAPPPGRGTEVVRLGPSTLRYLAHQVIHIDQEFQGMRQPLDFGLRSYFRVTITGPADTIGYPTTVTIDSIVPDSGMSVPMGINTAASKGLSFIGRLTPTGDFRNPVPSDTTTAQTLGPIIGSFRNFFPRLPAAGVTLGAIWIDTTTTTDRTAGNVVVTTISQSNAAAWEQRNGTRSLRIEVKSTFTIQGSGEQGGQPFEVAGTGVRSGIDYVAVDGRFLGGEARDSTNMTIMLPVQAMTIPRTQISRSTITVLP